VVYPEEALPGCCIAEINQAFSFELLDLVDIKVFSKRIIALTVTSTKLECLRIKYGLSKKLNYHGLLVPFHITLATIDLQKV